MKKRILLICVFLVCRVITAQTWETQNSGVNTKLTDVCFVDKDFGWVIGENSTIINTTNGGALWKKQISPVDSINFEKVQFINRSVGFITGWGGTILATKDGGITWVKSDSGVGTDYIFTGISFVDEKIGWVVGGVFLKPSYNTVIIKTSDGGESWQKQVEKTTPSSPENDKFKEVKFVNKNKGWVLAAGLGDNYSPTNLYKTTDGGKNWVKFSKILASVSHLCATEDDTIWAIGYGFARSSNGGVDWIYDSGLAITMGGTVSGLAIRNGKTGWIVDNHLGKVKVHYTDNYWQTWKDILDTTKISIGHISNIGNNYLWAVGGVGTIMKYSNPITSVKTEKYNSILSEYLLQNYPNPFNPTTIISFSLPQRGNVKLVVYDALGKEVATLANSVYETGKYSVQFNGSNLASGIYFYNLTTAQGTISKKMLLIK